MAKPKQPFPITAQNYSKGLDLTSGPESLHPEQLVWAENVRYTKTSEVVTRPGFLTQSSLGTSARVDAAGVMPNYSAIFAKSGTKIFQTIDKGVTCYDIGLTVTASKVGTFHSLGKDMFYTNDTDGFKRIAVSTLAANADATNHILQIRTGDITQFASSTVTSGTVYVRGIAVTFNNNLSYTVNTGTDFITATGQNLANGTAVVFTNSGGACPAGITAGTTYYVINKTTNTFQISTSVGGSNVDITDAGSGTNTFLATDSFLRGTSGETTAMKSGDLVTQTSAVTLPAAVGSGNCLTDFHGILWMAGGASIPQQLNNSGVPSPGHPEYAYDWAANGAYQSMIPYAVTCLQANTTVMLIGTNQGLYYCTGLNQDSAVPDVQIVSPLYSIPNQQSIAAIDNNTFVVFTGKRLLILTKDYYGVHLVDNAELPGGAFDYGIRKYLLDNADADQTNAWVAFDPNKRQVHANVIINGIGVIFVCNYDLQAWSMDTGEPYAWMLNFQNGMYAGGDGNDHIYADDELTDDDGIPIHSRILSAIYVLDERRVSSDYLGFEFNGYLSQGGSFTFRIYVNGALSPINQLITFDDLVTKNLLIKTTGSPVGGGTVAATTVGSGGARTTVYTYSIPIEFLLTGERIQFEWEVMDDGTVFAVRDSRLDGETVGTLYSDPL